MVSCLSRELKLGLTLSILFLGVFGISILAQKISQSENETAQTLEKVNQQLGELMQSNRAIAQRKRIAPDAYYKTIDELSMSVDTLQGITERTRGLIGKNVTEFQTKFPVTNEMASTKFTL